MIGSKSIEDGDDGEMEETTGLAGRERSSEDISASLKWRFSFLGFLSIFQILVVSGILAYSLHGSYFVANTTREEVTKAAKQDELLYAMNQLELKVDNWLRIHQQESKLLPKPEHRNSDVLASAATMPESCFQCRGEVDCVFEVQRLPTL